VKAFVINLESRDDRWHEVLSQESLLGFQIERVKAVTTKDVTGLEFVTAPVHATWLSHQKAMNRFLESGEEYGLILEDDFALRNNWVRFNLDEYKSLDFDFLQIGFLITTPLDFLELSIKSSFDFFLKVLQRITSLNILSSSTFANRFLLEEQRNVPFHLVCNDIRPGAHAYIVSRDFASAAQKFNLPVILSADALYIALGWMRSFKFLRTRRSYVSQSNSETSITERFLN
jgi:GR25 family glycosyltransferase involved in LPS biosynthesis